MTNLHEPGARGWVALGVVGALLMASGVGIGAFGAHGLEGSIPPNRLETFQTGVRYQLWHGLGVLGIVSLRLGRGAGWAIALGATIFAGSLYVLVLTDTPWLGAVAPIGGAAMVGGWLALAWAFLRPAKA